MARGALIKNGTVVDLFDAASDLNPNYGGKGIAFVPSEDAQIGDAWDGAAFVYNHVPVSVTPLQARLALNAAGLRSSVETALAKADQDTQDHWEFASLIHRDNPIVATVAEQLGLSSQKVDDLFRQAAKL